MAEINMELKRAVEKGDVELLKKLGDSKIPADGNYFLGCVNDKGQTIYHIAAGWGQVEFLKEAMKILPNHIIQKLLSFQDHNGYNPLHMAAFYGNPEIINLMIGYYKLYSGSIPLDNNNKPWLAQTLYERAIPLHFAIEKQGKENESAILEILSMDMDLVCRILDREDNSPLFLAVRGECNQVAEKILNSGYHYSLNGQGGSNALHVAHRCSDDVLRLILKKHFDKLNVDVLRKWIDEKAIGRLELLLDDNNFSSDNRSIVFRDLIKLENVNMLQLVLMIPNFEFAKVLINYAEQPLLRGVRQFENGDTPLHMAINLKREQHALYILSLDTTFCEISNYKGESPLFAAVQNNCEEVVENILSIYPNTDSGYAMLRSNDGRTLLHLLASCSEQMGTLLLRKFWWMMNLKADSGKTCLDEAKVHDVPWLVNMLANPSVIHKENFNWKIACEKGETWAVYAFIDSCTDLQEVCSEEMDTPLHHIKLTTYRECLNFLKIPSVNELKNTTNREGATPLHRALERKEIHLAKALLIDTEVERRIKDNTGKTALDLLSNLCKENDHWVNMCKQIKVDPYLKTKYIQPRTNLDQMRNTLSVVAALLATITFAAAFTLPGGIDGSNGQAMLAKKAAFIVFLLADAYAMCASIMVLFCLIWSMISEPDKSYFLVDRSVFILMTSLYSTMLAFMTGIFVVIAQKILWVAIIVLILCSLIGIAIQRTFFLYILFKMLPANKLFPTRKKDGNYHIV